MIISLARRLEKAERIAADKSARVAAKQAELEESINRFIEEAKKLDPPIDDLTREEVALFLLAPDEQNES